MIMRKCIIYLFLSFISNICYTQQLTNELIWTTGTFYPKSIDGIISTLDGDYYTSIVYRNGNQEIVKYRYRNNEEIKTLFSNKLLVDFKFSKYQISNDQNWILLSTSRESIYRHSSKSYYYLYSIEKNSITPLCDSSLGKQRLADFSPNSNKVAYVRKNNLYYINLNDFKEDTITRNGEMNSIINGATDWVYEEEFSFHKAFHWSSNGDNIAYYTFNESNVMEFQMEKYGTLYPTRYKFKYPKAGEDNSKVSINVYNIKSKKTLPFNLGNNQDIYIPRIMWSKKKDELIVLKMNRLQNKFELISGVFGPECFENKKVITKTIYTEESETYVDIQDNTEFINENEFFLTSEKNGFNHIYLVDYSSGKEKQITKGNWEVTNVYGYNSTDNSIYFQAAKKHPTQREVYVLNTKTLKIKTLSKKEGTNDAEFSSNFKYFINTYSDADKPFEITLNKGNGQKLKDLELNKSLKEKMIDFNLVDKEFLTIPNEDGLELNAWMMKPIELDTNSKHPLLMFVYGGPGINTVNDSWSWMNYFWFQLLVKKGFVVVSVDARGTGFRGRDFKHSTYLQLGKYETMDQIDAAKYLGKMNFIDKDNIGIFGWSYGGYMSSLCITKGADVFNSAIAVAPVTNWRYYDNIYTERFMRTPEENGDNYDLNSPINHVDKLRGNYLLIHGTADDNVHFQNAIEMVAELVNSNKDFDFFAYPDKNHGIYGGMTRLHLYNKMTDFLVKNLKQ
jgi:dipeptidyl-peptidase-4